MVAMVRALGTRLEAVSKRLEQQSEQMNTAEQRYDTVSWRLAAALTLLAVLAAGNILLTLLYTRCK